MIRRSDEQFAYHCPGEHAPISRSVHLGRLAAFYPACRRCPHRHETGSITPRRDKRLAEASRRAQVAPWFTAEGVDGVYRNDIDAKAANRLAGAAGVCLRRLGARRTGPPRVVVSADARPLVVELLAAVADGLRWAGCEVVEIEPASAPCLARAIQGLSAQGGIFVGNPTGLVHRVGLKFWAEHARPLSEGDGLDEVRRMFERGVSRPVRKYGPSRRFPAEAPYLAELATYYHALRPLRFVVSTTCPPIARYVRRLAGEVACEVRRCRVRPDQLGEQVKVDCAHFGVALRDDGEICRFWDERGKPIPPERVFDVVAAHLGLATDPFARARSDPTHGLAARKPTLGSEGTRAATYRSMRDRDAPVGAGPGGHIWYRSPDGHVAPDGLRTLTWVLQILSRSDRPLSEVLDGAAAAG